MKEDIDKLDEQIQNILDTEKEMKKDEKKASDDILNEVNSVSTDTKKIENVEDLTDDTLEEETIEEEEQDTLPEKKNEDILPTNDDNVEKKENSEKKFNNKLLIYIILSVIILILLIILLTLVLSKKDKKEDTVKELSKEEQSIIIQKYGDALKGIVAIYLDKNEVVLTYDEATQLINFDYDIDCSEHEIYEDGSVYLNQCMIDDKKTGASYGKKQVPKEQIIPEGAIKIYVTENGASFDEPKKGIKYDVYGLVINEPYSDLTFFDAKNSDYVYYVVDSNTDPYTKVVNYKTNESLADKLYMDRIYPIKVGEKMDSDYVVIAKKSTWESTYKYGVYNISKGLQVISPGYDDLGSLLELGVMGPRYYVNALEKNKMSAVFYNTYYKKISQGIIDYTNGNRIIPLECEILTKENNYLWCRKDGESVIYDYSGNKQFTNKYDKIYGLVDGKYLLVQEGKNLKMYNTSGKQLYDYGEYSFKSINYALKYGDGAIFQFVNNTKGEDFDYDTDESCIEVVYTEEKKGSLKATYCGGIAKPILYLYPEKKTKVNITFQHPEYLETTYPKFIKSWDVVAYPNGDLYDNNNKYYYGLYWDEKKVHAVDFHEGFYVDKEHAIEFLEEKLNFIGLNDRERNEFIMYWLPILEKNEKNLVYFELTDERESVNAIKISPKPDSLLRIVIHVKKVNDKVSVKEQKLVSFKRKGFVAVEWGGTTY